jgi:hypothetical protein
MYWKLPQVLGLDLNRSEGAVRTERLPPRPQTAYRQKFLNLSGASSV